MADTIESREELDISDGDAAEVEDQDTGGEAEDRGDEVSPPASREALEDVAGDAGRDGGEAAKGDGDNGDSAESGARDSRMIPKARFDEVNNERRWLREQLAAARGGQAGEGAQATETAQQPEPFDFDAAEERFLDAMYEGDKEQAKAIRREINEENRRLAREQAAHDAREHVSQHEATTALNQAAAAVVADYPFLNSEAEGANEEAISDVVGWRDIYMARGKTPAEALRMAADKVGPMYAPAASGGGQASDNAGDQRAAAAKRRNADAANRQPPNVAGVGARGETEDDLNIEEMSDEEFDNLSPAAKARLRGD